MIKAFLFDLGNVLVRFSHDRMYEQVGAVLGLAPGEVHDRLAAERLQWRYEAGDVTTADLVDHLRIVARKDFDLEALLVAVSDIFTPMGPMVTLTRALAARGHRLVLVSNTNEAHISFIKERYDVLRPFAALILSYEVRAMKPDPAFYAAAHVVSGCAAGECLFVDDLAENVAGALAFGFQAWHFTGEEAFRADLEGRGLLP